MSILNKEKLAELLTANWTKFIDYRTLMSLVINSVKLYASNWSMLEYDKKIQGNKIMVSKTTISERGLILWVDFEVPIDKKLAIGTIEMLLELSGNYRIEKIVGNLFYNN